MTKQEIGLLSYLIEYLRKGSKMLDFINSSRKALVPPIVGGVLYVLAETGIAGDMSVKDAVTLGVTGILVWFTRNR